MILQIALIIILLTSAIIFFKIALDTKKKVKKIKTKNRIQPGKITYSDLDRPSEAIFSKKNRIIGKPDYITKKDHHYIPVELKSGNHFNPKKNHIMQLAAYCQLIEDNYNVFVPYGILVYNDISKDFKIPFDTNLRFELELILKKMRKNLKNGKIKINHDDPRRCTSCSMRYYCDKKLN